MILARSCTPKSSLQTEGMNLKFKIRISYCSRHKVPVVIDARMDDAVWQDADIGRSFYAKLPLRQF